MIQNRKHLVSQALLAFFLLGCSDDTKQISIEIVTGHETDTFSQTPAVTRVDIRAMTAEGDVSLKASAPPGGSFDFGEVPSDRLFSFDVTGIDASGNTVVRGRSVGAIFLAALAGDYIPVYAQRVNQWARPPGKLLHAHLDAPATTMAERYVVTSGGSKALSNTGDVSANTSEFYDLLGLAGAEGPTFSMASTSMLGRLASVLTINDNGATWVDFDLGAFGEVVEPSGLMSFAEIAGAKPVESSDGRAFFIGATRGNGPSDIVLVVNEVGLLSTLKLNAPRDGAAAVWMDEVGLIVAGGSADAPGIEVLPKAGSVFETRDFAPDAVMNAGAVFGGTKRVVLMGGRVNGMAAPTRTIDLECTTDCMAAMVEAANLPLELERISAYAVDANRSVAIGTESTGEGFIRSFLVNVEEGSAQELVLKEPRKGAAITATPIGTLAIIGGVHSDGTPALTMETLFPL